MSRKILPFYSPGRKPDTPAAADHVIPFSLHINEPTKQATAHVPSCPDVPASPVNPLRKQVALYECDVRSLGSPTQRRASPCGWRILNRVAKDARTSSRGGQSAGCGSVWCIPIGLAQGPNTNRDQSVDTWQPAERPRGFGSTLRGRTSRRDRRLIQPTTVRPPAI